MNIAVKQDPSPFLPEGEAQQAEAASPVGGSQFWDIPETGAFQGQDGGLSPTTGAFSELVQIESAKKSSSTSLLLVILLLIGPLAYLGYQYTETGENPLPGLWASLNGASLPEQPASETVPKVEGPKVAAVPDPEPAAPPLAAPTLVPPENPYWLLPNKIVGKRAQMGRSWTAAEEEVWRAGLAHKFVYQRYKAVMDVRKAMLSGSEAILWDALDERKFWTRMQAVMGLADFGIPVNLEVVEKAIGGTHPEAVTNFFRRFVRTNTAGERYILRQALRIVDEPSRLVILGALNRVPDSLRDLYFVAATYDPGQRVQAWLPEATLRRGISGEARTEYQELLAKAVTPDEDEEATPATKPDTVPAAAPADASMEEEDVEEPSEVEIYDIDSITGKDSAMNDLPVKVFSIN